MKLLRIALRRETAVPMLALCFASAVSVTLVIARVIWTGNIRYSFLIWNLFLAWLPLVFSLLAQERYHNGAGRDWKFLALVAAWLLFFPNAPYIFTDLIHLTGRFYGHFWVDMVLILLCAMTGLVLGFVSVYLMQEVVARMLGRLASWIFIAGVACLGGIGIYVGRFLRFNSWDIIFKPLALSRGLGNLAADPAAHYASLAFAALFATFLFIAYLMLYALTHLRQTPLVNTPQKVERFDQA